MRTMSDIPTNNRRRYLRFSVRVMVLLVLLIASPLAWMVNKARQQRMAVAALETLGCSIYYDHYRETVNDQPPVVRGWIGKLLGRDMLQTVHIVDARGSKIADAGLCSFRA